MRTAWALRLALILRLCDRGHMRVLSYTSVDLIGTVTSSLLPSMCLVSVVKHLQIRCPKDVKHRLAMLDRRYTNRMKCVKLCYISSILGVGQIFNSNTTLRHITTTTVNTHYSILFCTSISRLSATALPGTLLQSGQRGMYIVIDAYRGRCKAPPLKPSKVLVQPLENFIYFSGF